MNHSAILHLTYRANGSFYQRQMVHSLPLKTSVTWSKTPQSDGTLSHKNSNTRFFARIWLSVEHSQNTDHTFLFVSHVTYPLYNFSMLVAAWLVADPRNSNGNHGGGFFVACGRILLLASTEAGPLGAMVRRMFLGWLQRWQKHLQ